MKPIKSLSSLSNLSNLSNLGSSVRTLRRFAWWPVRNGTGGYIWLRWVVPDGEGLLGSTIGYYRVIPLYKVAS